ncbi:MFS transporter [Bordetella avium]|uniref:MFS transporter n=1 Tax=Bordetella avium TaxID=521 RepID=UPI000E0A94D1|nr:MFS transporter [Bordetella avium]RIQ14147.1 MFS transporter [Bordetella avium]RIQ39844.1 MFS transporter [Bordetella avium]RIQ44642.1 MFS transporter [Bordetella avium]RIQ45138.1 MFS transporter [Bordetella avium]RIQ51683.1 MFS transporter [Bordetella avium]
MTRTLATPSRHAQQLPLGGLLALAMAAFITLLTEILPAGVLSSIAQSLEVSESLAGQFITVYAVGALVAAIPVMTLTQGVRRRPLLLFAIAGFAVVNLLTALSRDYTLSITARFFAGVFGGIVWSMLAGYAVRISPAHLSGRAIATVGIGGTIALVLGVPAGALLGRHIGWQAAFGLMSLLALVLIVWIKTVVPDFAGQSRDQRQPLAKVFLKPGIRAVLIVVFSFVVAHNILYIYIEPLLQVAGLASKVDVVLFTFGAGSVVGLWMVGALVDRRLRFLALANMLLFALAAMLFGLWGHAAPIVYSAAALWGLAVGGFGTLTQAALSRFAGDSVDVAQAMYTTGWNTAVAAGGIVGGLLLGWGKAQGLAWAAMAVLAISLIVTMGFMNPALRRQTRS